MFKFIWFKNIYKLHMNLHLWPHLCEPTST